MRIHAALISALVVAPAFVAAGAPDVHAADPAAFEAALGAPRAVAQDEEEEKEDNRAEVATLIEQLEGHLKARGEEDDEAIRVIRDLSVEFDNSGPKDRKAIAKIVAECVEVKRKELAEDVPDQKLQTEAAKAMGGFGEEGGDLLLKLVDSKELEGKAKAQRETILSLGRTKHEKGVKVLVKMLDDKNYEVEGAAAQALGNYSDAKEKVRKDIVEALLKKIVPLSDLMEDSGDYSGTGQADSNEDFEEKRKEYEALASGTMSSLALLTGHSEEDFRGWQAWWNDNKREKWD
ncbi:MAG: HEAT repeat domain-containing protein [Planctomycetota bacterium]